MAARKKTASHARKPLDAGLPELKGEVPLADTLPLIQLDYDDVLKAASTGRLVSHVERKKQGFRHPKGKGGIKYTYAPVLPQKSDALTTISMAEIIERSNALAERINSLTKAVLSNRDKNSILEKEVSVRNNTGEPTKEPELEPRPEPTPPTLKKPERTPRKYKTKPTERQRAFAAAIRHYGGSASASQILAYVANHPAFEGQDVGRFSAYAQTAAKTDYFAFRVEPQEDALERVRDRKVYYLTDEGKAFIPATK